jgi:OmpR-family two-component system manganese-sensing response regulator
MSKILVVEDDATLASTLRRILLVDHNLVDVANEGDEALAYILSNNYDLIILDWELPNRSGVEVCQTFRNRGGTAPVLFLTGKAHIEDKEKGFAVGGDDYLTKPFEMRELTARVNALLRRPQSLVGKTLKVGNLELDTRKFRLMRDGVAINLVPQEFALLEFLMKHPDELYSWEALAARVWPTDSESSAEAVRQCVSRLRRKIDVEGKPSLIRTVSGAGYILEPPDPNI